MRRGGLRRISPSCQSVDNPLCPRSQLFAYFGSIVPSGGKGHLEMTMAALLIGYVVAIAIVFFASRPISIKRPRTRPME